MVPPPDPRAVDDLVTFTRIEITSHDVEPWADIISALHGTLDAEQTAWLLTLYNTYDDLHSAWRHFRRWPTPGAWAASPGRDDAAAFNCTQERRNLRGGRVLRRHSSYTVLLRGGEQLPWLTRTLRGDHPGRDFTRLTTHLKQVWGVGRQAAFEWAEFLVKCAGVPADAADGQLWESSGPRRSIERIYRLTSPSARELDACASHLRDHLAGTGVPLSWTDFETVICDFNVMRDGRYYPGKHLAAITEEIAAVTDPEGQALLRSAFDSFVPDPWRSIRPGIRRELQAVYRDTGRIVSTPDARPALAGTGT